MLSSSFTYITQLLVITICETRSRNLTAESLTNESSRSCATALCNRRTAPVINHRSRELLRGQPVDTSREEVFRGRADTIGHTTRVSDTFFG
jgi:hypothetical protein